jgi:hypothetical protein
MFGHETNYMKYSEVSASITKANDWIVKENTITYLMKQFI